MACCDDYNDDIMMTMVKFTVCGLQDYVDDIIVNVIINDDIYRDMF